MTRVLVVGCGIVGPAISIMLHDKGYEPIIAEKIKQVGDAGLALTVWPNGAKVLNAIGITDYGGIPFATGIEYNSDGEELGRMDQSYHKRSYGVSSRGVRRTEILQRLKSQVKERGIPIYEGWELNEIRQTTDGIIALPKDGDEIKASFLIGCDGLHSTTRRMVLQMHGKAEDLPTFTGLVTWGGFAPHPDGLEDHSLCGWYGDGKYFLSYQVDEKSSIWGIIRPGREERENWKLRGDVSETRVQLTEEFSGWPETVRALIAGTDQVAKFGLYDRPELPPEQWYYGRCVLLGDAAHPTSPHLGQGANQGLEDCWHLCQTLPDAVSDLSEETLKSVFRSYAYKRQPRTTSLTKSARAQGQTRIVHGKEACELRNTRVKKFWEDPEALKVNLHNLYREPFMLEDPITK